jgi:hypothetical protein
MAARRRQEDESGLSPDAPIRRWFADQSPAEEFDRNGGSVTPIEVTHIREQTPETEPLPHNVYQPVTTLDEIYTDQPYENAEQVLDPVEDTLLPPKPLDETLAIGGLKRLIPNIRHFRDATAGYLAEKSDSIKNHGKTILGAGAIAVSGTIRASINGTRKASYSTRLYTNEKAAGAWEFYGRHQKKIQIGIGAVAVMGGLVGLSTETNIMDNLGISHLFNGLDHTHEAAKHAQQTHHEAVGHVQHAQHAAEHSKTTVHHEAHQDISSIHKSKTETSYNFNATPGDSVTREIQNVGAEHGKHFSPQKAFDIYLNLKDKIRGHIAHRT